MNGGQVDFSKAFDMVDMTIAYSSSSCVILEFVAVCWNGSNRIWRIVLNVLVLANLKSFTINPTSGVPKGFGTAVVPDIRE